MNKEAIINQFINSLKNLSLEANEQITIYPDFVVVTDELLLDFDNWYTVVKGNYPDFFSEEEKKVLEELNLFLDNIPVEDLNQPEINELKNSSFWKELRFLAKEVILKINHI
jgi:hypothetical protein